MKMPFPLAEEPDAQSIEKGRLLFAGQTEFVKGVVAMSGLPDADRIGFRYPHQVSGGQLRTNIISVNLR